MRCDGRGVRAAGITWVGVWAKRGVEGELLDFGRQSGKIDSRFCRAKVGEWQGRGRGVAGQR